MTTPAFMYNDLNTVLKRLREEKSFAVDTETNGLQPYNGDRLVGISFYFPEAHEMHYLSFFHGAGENLSLMQFEVLKEVWNVVVQGDVQVLYFNALFDLHMMLVDAFVAPKNVIEVLVAAKLLNENEHYSNDGATKGAYRLKRLAPKYLGEWAISGEDDLVAKAKAKGLDPKSEMYKLSGEDVAYYAAVDAYITYALYQHYDIKLKAWGLKDLENEENTFLRQFLLRAENNGVKVDMDVLYSLKAKEQETMDSVQSELDTLLESKGLRYVNDHRRINIASPAQVSRMLNDFGLSLPSTGADYINSTLIDLENSGDTSDVVQVLKLISQHREAATPIKLYYNKYPDYVSPSGFLHPNHFIGGARTGRLTCSSPNTQQISKKGGFKQVFVPRSDDYYFVSVDLSQAELRVAAHYCQEETMLGLMRTGQDMHQFTADKLSEELGRPISRQLGKMANFGLLYRMSPPKASVKFGVDLELAEGIVYGWRKLYRNFELGYYSALQIAEKWRTPDGTPTVPGLDAYQYFKLPYDGRVRHFDEAAKIRAIKEQTGQWDVRKGDKYVEYGQTKTADRDLVLKPYDEHYKAFNFMIQGTIQAVMRKGILQIMREFGNEGVKPMMTVYDSVIFDVRKPVFNDFAKRVKEIMYYPEFTIPLTVDIEYGSSYGNLTEYEE